MMMMDTSSASGPSFETEVRRRLGITANEFLARLKYDDIAEFAREDVDYLLALNAERTPAE